MTPTDSVSTYELYNSTLSRIVSDDAIVLLYTLDTEAHELTAVLLVGGWGTGVVPVALRVATPDPRQFDVTPGATAGTFDVSVGARTIHLRVERGGAVLLDDVLVGKIR